MVDFCCPEYRLAIELDGRVHATQQDHDAEREALPVAAGYSVVRFANDDVINDLPAVLETIEAAARDPIRPSQHVSRTAGW